MRRWIIIMSLVAVGLLVQACARQVDIEEPCNFVQNTASQRVSWGKESTLKLSIHQSVSSDYTEAIKDAARTWNEIIGREVIKIDILGVSGSGPARDGYSILYSLKEWDDDRPQEQARTTIYWAGHGIYEADIILNEDNFAFSIEDEPATDEIDLYSLLVHEFGHALGLSHVEDANSVMYANLSGGMKRREITDVEQKSLACEYL